MEVNARDPRIVISQRALRRAEAKRAEAIRGVTTALAALLVKRDRLEPNYFPVFLGLEINHFLREGASLNLLQIEQLRASIERCTAQIGRANPAIRTDSAFAS